MSESKRAIKFRAWNNERKVMVPIQYLVAINQEFSEWGVNGYPRNETFELMQFTGLKDKNGKDIYEGDILRWIEYWLDHGNVAVEFKDSKWFPLSEFIGHHTSDFQMTEVIGNIYENPELLSA